MVCTQDLKLADKQFNIGITIPQIHTVLLGTEIFWALFDRRQLKLQMYNKTFEFHLRPQNWKEKISTSKIHITVLCQ